MRRESKMNVEIHGILGMGSKGEEPPNANTLGPIAMFCPGDEALQVSRCLRSEQCLALSQVIS